jgi:hypothetical protein
MGSRANILFPTSRKGNSELPIKKVREIEKTYLLLLPDIQALAGNLLTTC